VYPKRKTRESTVKARINGRRHSFKI